MDESKISWNFFPPSPPHPALCNSIAIFSMKGSPPKNVCVLELWFLENSEQNQVLSDDKNCCMFQCILVVLHELYWRIHSKRQEALDKRGVASLLEQHGDLPIMLLCYVVTSIYLIVFCVLSTVLREVAWRNKWSVDLGDLDQLEALVKPQHPSVFASVFCVEKQELCFLCILAGCWE